VDADEWKKQALAHYRAGAYAQASETFVAAGAAYTQAGDRIAAAEMLNNQGVAHRMLRQWDRAEAAFLQARRQFETLNEANQQAQATANLGMLALARGQARQAITFLDEAIALFQTTDDPQRESEARRTLSLAHFKQRHLLDALAAYSAALDCAPHLTLGQRFLRWLLALPARLLGGR